MEDNINIFKCPLCKRTNCMTCQVGGDKEGNLGDHLQAVHDGMDCKQYQQYALNDAQDENSKKTREWIEVGQEKRLDCDLVLQRLD